MTTTTQSGSERTTGLADETLRKIQSSAAKMVGDKGEPQGLSASLLGISDKLAASEAAEPPLQLIDEKAAGKAQCLSWGFPRRHLREPRQNLKENAEWLEKLNTLGKLSGTGFLVSLVGERWTGKTMMACRLALAHVVRDPNFTALYVRVAEFFIAIKDSYRQDGPSESAQIERFSTPDLLVIDELNDRGDTRWEEMMLTLLIDRRYGDMKDTLVISNHTQEAFEESVGPSIYRRLVQTGGHIKCDWPSFEASARLRRQRMHGETPAPREPERFEEEIH